MAKFEVEIPNSTIEKLGKFSVRDMAAEMLIDAAKAVLKNTRENIMYNSIFAAEQPKPAAPTKKSNEEIAREVIAGKWGNGTDRKNRLTAAGYNYAAVQAIVNKKVAENKLKPIDEIAREVIRGNWGNGAERVKRLTAAGYNAKAIWIRGVYEEPNYLEDDEWSFWQFSNRHVLDGYSGQERYIDMNVYNGTFDKFLIEFALEEKE